MLRVFIQDILNGMAANFRNKYPIHTAIKLISVQYMGKCVGDGFQS
jgi:hypothetical protein